MEQEELKNILKLHEAWLDGKEGGEQIDLDDVDLYGADLRGASLREVGLRGADLRGADLRHVDLRGASLPKNVLLLEKKPWRVVIQEDCITIGCQRHTPEEWAAFTDAQISEMYEDALSFWRKNKVKIFAEHQKMLNRLQMTEGK